MSDRDYTIQDFNDMTEEERSVAIVAYLDKLKTMRKDAATLENKLKSFGEPIRRLGSHLAVDPGGLRMSLDQQEIKIEDSAPDEFSTSVHVKVVESLFSEIIRLKDLRKKISSIEHSLSVAGYGEFVKR